MQPLKPIRRVITGHTPGGRSVVVSDAQTTTFDIGSGHMTLYDIWSVAEVPAPVEANQADPTDIPLNFELPSSGVRVRFLDIPPDATAPAGMHRTESIDVAIVIEGEMCMPLDDQEVVLHRGDVLIQRGTNHAWVNRSAEICRMLYVIIGGKMSPELLKSLDLSEVVWHSNVVDEVQVIRRA